ncbi:MAG: hypothetical protein Q4A74_01630 [Cardiobacteriaceae bacterium]|nr:hypothetical protein [Cardiobacteriaceae bacterium]
MKVQAIQTGYYGGELRYAGDVFDVPEGESGVWFIRLKAPPEEVLEDPLEENGGRKRKQPA